MLAQESKWIEEKQKAESLGRDLADARKTSKLIRSYVRFSRQELTRIQPGSKLRAHLEDSRADNRKQVDQCKEHTAELDARRQQMTKLSEETQQGRASLQAANAQVATLKAQLDRAVEQKVQKRLLKVSFLFQSRLKAMARLLTHTPVLLESVWQPV